MYYIIRTHQINLYFFYRTLFFTTFAFMTVKEFLKTNPLLNLSAVAREMYPKNKDASSYLVRKLNDTGRPFTRKDAETALKVLKDHAAEISTLTID